MLQHMLTLTLSLLLTLTFITCSPLPLEKEYGVVLDAGSSSTKIRAYSWTPTKHGVPQLETLVLAKNATSKLKPGISSFENKVFEIKFYLQTLLDILNASIPKAAWASTPVYFMATAGLRLLDENVTHAIISEVEEVMRSPNSNPFLFDEGYVRILSGEEEAMFAWLTINYLNGFFDTERYSDASDSYGLVELGGGSLQIAFMPEDPIYAGKMSAQMAGRGYDVYGHSHLSYGATLMSRRVGEYLVRQNPNAYVIVNPCMLKADRKNSTFYDKEVVMVGGGNASLCEGILQHYLKSADEDMCSPKPCSIGQVYQPPIGQRKFFTFGAVYIIAKELGVLDDPGRLDIGKFATIARTYCSKTIDEVVSEGLSRSWASRNCQDGLYIPMFLRSFGFHDNTSSLYAGKNIGGSGISWSIGAILYEEEREKYELFGSSLLTKSELAASEG